MKKLILLLVSLGLLLLLSSRAFCFEATARVSKNQISINDSVILRITIEGGKADIDTSIITDFRVESRGSGTNVSILNGNYSRTTSYTYLLFPLRQGTLMIPPIKIVDGNKITTTEKITITVSDQTVNDNISNDFFAKASISDSTVFTGQNAIYTVKFFFAKTLYEARLEEHNAKNFSKKLIKEQKNYQTTINGKLYTVYEINYLITPLSEEDFTIEPISVIAKIDMEGSNPDNFGIDSFFSTRKTIKKVSSNSIKIKVKPIPEYTGKEKFKGLVGDFKIKATINKTTMQVGESATLTLTVSGRGNIMDSAIENIGLPEDSFNVYDDQPLKKEELTEKGYFKTKTFKKAIVPLKPGDFTIPESSLLYFDTEADEYKKAWTEPLNIIVTESTKSEETNFQISNNAIETKLNKKEAVEFTGRDILSLKQDADVLINQKELGFNLFIFLVTLPFFLFILIKFYISFKKTEKSNSAIMKQKALHALKKAKRSDLSNDQFLNYLRSAVVSAILSKGDKSGESITKDETYQILGNTNLNNDDIEDILKTLNDIESAKYGKKTLVPKKKEELFAKVRHLAKLCSVFICIMSFVSLVPSPNLKAQTTQTFPNDNSGTLFLEGVKEYNAGNFKISAQNFETIALNGTKNGKLYYNIGNAFLKAGDLGKAILWYERSKKRTPFDTDLKFNLDYAQDKLKDINDSKSFDFIDILFFWKNYFSSNLINYSAIILSFLFFIYSSIRILKRKNIFTTSASIFFILLLLILGIALTDYYQTYNSNTAIIIPEKVSVRSGLSEDSTELFILHSGTKVKVDKEQNKFFRISFSKDKIGWIQKKDAIKI